MSEIAEKKFPDRISVKYEIKAYTRADMIRAFVQGAEYGWNEYDPDYSGLNFDDIEKAYAKIEAKSLLKKGKLGKEE